MLETFLLPILTEVMVKIIPRTSQAQGKSVTQEKNASVVPPRQNSLVADTGKEQQQIETVKFTQEKIDEYTSLVEQNRVRSGIQMSKKRVFIGCSNEGKLIAQVLQLLLNEVANIEIWNQGVFDLTKGTLETLAKKVNSYDYAIFILSNDDLIMKRERQYTVSRDNVIFELGLFIGALGRERTFIVLEKKVTIPSDLYGVSVINYTLEDSINIISALGPVATRIQIFTGML
jgi:predicted nucleotide-binding protein